MVSLGDGAMTRMGVDDNGATASSCPYVLLSLRPDNQPWDVSHLQHGTPDTDMWNNQSTEHPAMICGNARSTAQPGNDTWHC